MNDDTTDQAVRDRIASLVNEEHELYARTNRTPEEQQRLKQIQVELDQSWALMRQRRALRDFGDDPGKAGDRLEDVVENYGQ